MVSDTPKRGPTRGGSIACVLLPALGACADRAPLCAAPPGDRVTIVDQGWHTEIGLPADRLAGALGRFATTYPGARTLMFGYGKRTFITAPPRSLGEYLIGPFPGPAVIETIALSAAPGQAYPAADLVTLTLPQGGGAALSAFVWDSFGKDGAGGPRLVGPARLRGALFYAARARYTLTHTCNTWVAEALRAAGLPIRPAGVVLAGDVMGQARHAAARQCRAAQRQGGAEPSGQTTRAPGGTTTVVSPGEDPPPKLELQPASPTSTARPAATRDTPSIIPAPS